MQKSADFVTKLMIEYDVFVPLHIIGGVVAFSCLLTIVLYFTKANYLEFFRSLSWILLVGYLFLSLCATIFYRNKTEELRYSLYPLRSYVALYDKALIENVLNIFLFLPIGFLICVVTKNRNLYVAFCIGCVLSITIELIQLVSKRGVCNIDDLIHNAIGCLIGCGLFLVCYKRFVSIGHVK